MNHFGYRVRKRREQLGYTREELAERIGITPRSLARVEAGENNCSFDVLKRISRSLCITTDYLLFGGEESEDHSLSIRRLLETLDEREARHLEEVLQALLRALHSPGG